MTKLASRRNFLLSSGALGSSLLLSSCETTSTSAPPTPSTPTPPVPTPPEGIADEEIPDDIPHACVDVEDEAYHRWMVTYRSVTGYTRLLRYFLSTQLLDLRPDDRLLDVGAGDGVPAVRGFLPIPAKRVNS
jgi:hypothetical protein